MRLLLAAGLFSFSTAVSAQEAPVCKFIDGRICAVSNSAAITQASGEVFVNALTSFSPAIVGSNLGPGQSVLTRNGMAQVRLSNACQTSVSANALLRISRSGEFICAAQQLSAPPVNPAQQGLATPVIVGGVAATLLVGGAVLLKDEKRPPISP